MIQPGMRNSVSLSEELDRLARFGANISEAHSCFIFLPITVLNSFASFAPRADSPDLKLVGYHSLSQNVAVGCEISIGNGLIGWVAKNLQPIHVSPFERDSRVIGAYTQEQQLKSFIGVPIRFTRRFDQREVGVLASDSRKSFAFSKIQIKWLEELAFEVARITELCSQAHSPQISSTGSVKEFLRKSLALAEVLGVEHIEILRLSPTNIAELEQVLGPNACYELLEQVSRLIQQCLPPHYACTRLASGDFVLALDSMMSSFYESKIMGVVRHVSDNNIKLELESNRASIKQVNSDSFTIEDLINLSSITTARVSNSQNYDDQGRSEGEYQQNSQYSEQTAKRVVNGDYTTRQAVQRQRIK